MNQDKDSKIFKHPNQPKRKEETQTDRFNLVKTVKNIKTRANGQKRVPLRTFINSGEDDNERGDETARTEMSMETTTTSCCLDYTTHGRCLGYHPAQQVPFKQTVTPSGASCKFNQTLNESTLLGKSAWTNQLNNLPQWTVQEWLKYCPSKWIGNLSVPYKNPVGASLPNLVNESMRERSRTSAILARVSATTPKPTSSFLQPSPANSSDITSPNGYTSRVRLQMSPNGIRITPKKNQDVIQLEGWNILRIEDTTDVCVQGRNRCRKIWRSGAIVRRRSPRSVESSVGTIYNLVGKPSNTDQLMPAYIEESFSIGFPHNWDELVKKWFSEDDRVANVENSRFANPKQQKRKAFLTSSFSRSKIRPPAQGDVSGPESDEESSSLASSASAMHNTTILQKTFKAAKYKDSPVSSVTDLSDGQNPTNAQLAARMIPKTHKTVPSTKPIVNREPGNCDEDDGVSEIEHALTTAPRVLLTRIDSGVNAKKNTYKELGQDRWISNWRLVPNFEDKTTIKLAGCLTDDDHTVIEKDHLSPDITTRKNNNVVATDKGINYKLIGPPLWIKPTIGETSVPEILQQKFCKGFPPKWRQFLEELHQDHLASSIPKKKTEVPMKKSKPIIYDTDEDDEDLNANIVKNVRAASPEQPRGKRKEKKKNIPLPPSFPEIRGDNRVPRPDDRTMTESSVKAKPYDTVPYEAEEDSDEEIEYVLTTAERLPNTPVCFSGVKYRENARKMASPLSNLEEAERARKIKFQKLVQHRWISKWRLVPTLQDKTTFKLAGCLIDANHKVIERNHISADAIKKRLDNYVVITKGDITYHLVGPPLWMKQSKGATLIPETIEQKFSKGFPTRWQAVLKLVYGEEQKPSTSKTKTGVFKKTCKPVFDTTGVDDDDDEDDDLNADTAREVVGIRFTTSSRGRKIIPPLKFYEGEKLVVKGDKAFVKKKNAYKNVKGLTPDKMDAKTKKKATNNTPMKSSNRAGIKKQSSEEKKSDDAVQAKRPRLAESNTTKKLSKPQESEKSGKPGNAGKSSKSEAAAATAATAAAKKEAKPNKKRDIEFSELDDEEIDDIMASNPKNKKEKDRKADLLAWMEDKATHKDKDLFALTQPDSDEETCGDNTDLWDTDSVSSKVTSDDDRMKFNYTPPGNRMSKLVSKTTPHRHDVSIDFEDNKNNNKRSKDFIQRQLKKPKNLTKKQREEQEVALAKTAKLMKYKSEEPENPKLVNKLYTNLTSGTVDQRVKDFINQTPQEQDDDDEDDTLEEQYFSDDEDSKDGSLNFFKL